MTSIWFNISWNQILFKILLKSMFWYRNFSTVSTKWFWFSIDSSIDIDQHIESLDWSTIDIYRLYLYRILIESFITKWIWHWLSLPGESLGELRNGIFQGPGETATAPLDHHCRDTQDGAQQGEPELRIRDEENEGSRPQYLKRSI